MNESGCSPKLPVQAKNPFAGSGAHPAPGGLRGWFGRQSIRVKLNTITLVYVTIILSLLAIAAFASSLNNGVRAYTQGESLWSKAQKDAVHYLMRYAQLRDENDYRKYLREIAIPLGDRAGRLELEKPVYDYAVVERGFIAGGNAPADVPYMISLYRRFHDVGELKRAIAIWNEADVQILQLIEAADQIHAAITAGRLTAQRERQLLDRVEQINARLTPIEIRFTATLGEAARGMRVIVLAAVLFLGLALLGSGLLISTWISRQLRNGLMTLRAGTQRVAEGDLSLQIPVATQDEIGELTHDFNDMIVHRRQAEAENARHRSFEGLITRLSTGMISLTQELLDPGINHALGEIGRFAQVDRSYIFAFDDSRTQVSCTHEWCAQDIPPEIGRLQNLQVAEFPWVEARLQRGEVVHVRDLDALPPEAAAERAEWQAESIQSLLLVPMSLGGAVVGYVGFDAVRAKKTWSEESIALLRIFGEMVINVLQRRRSEAHIQRLAHHDPLTQLPNRALLMDRLDMALEQARRNGSLVALLMLDLDHFKNINDSLGHSAGDQLLRTVATRLSGCARKTDTVARMGGDEFVIVLTDVKNRDTVERIVQAMVEEVSAPIVIESHELVVTPSIGISVFPDDGAHAIGLMKSADTAMYQAKAQGRGNYQWFAPRMMLAVDERLELEHGLRRALERREFSLDYQPLVSIKTGQVVGSEALIRWNHPRRGIVLPRSFIPLAEETGLIVPIGAWVLRQACIEGKRLQAQLGKPLIISVNISTRQFRQDNLLRTVEDVLVESGLPPHTLVLEITESALAANPQETAVVLKNIRELGVRIAVDDFGTGYSSLSYITRFPIDLLKIDASFVRDLIEDQGDAAITSAIIALAHSLKLDVVAEGVETQEQLAFLRERVCNEAQGFYFGKPVPAAQFSALAGQIDRAANDGSAVSAFAGVG